MGFEQWGMGNLELAINQNHINNELVSTFI